MKKWMIISALVLGAGIAQAATQNNVWTGNGDDNDFNAATNWWNSVTTNDNCFFRGDGIAAHPARTNANITAPVTITRLNLQGSINSNAVYNITGSGGALTIDGQPENITASIEVFNVVVSNQIIAADVVFNTAGNANNQHIKTGTGAGLILSGAISQPSTSMGLGFAIGNGDVEIAGSVSGSKLWKVRDNGGSGVLKVTGTWLGGTLQIDANTAVLLNRATTDNTALSGTILQLVGGDLMLANDEQIANNVNITFNRSGGYSGTILLDGHTETIGGINFAGAILPEGAVDMGEGGVLNLANQVDTAAWGSLTVTNWDSGVDHIYVTGGSFGASQLAAIAFSGWEPAGAKVELGELLPTGSNVTVSAYQAWADGFGVGDGTNDFDNDGLLNIYEYGLGGDPTNNTDQGTSPEFGVVNVGGTNYFGYVYPQLSDANSGLSYYLEITGDLAFPAWTNAGYAVTGTNVTGGLLDFVTNATTTVEGKKFVRLIIESL